MSKKMQFGSIIGAAVMVSAMSAVVHAEVSPFATQDVAVGMQLAANSEGKCGAAAKAAKEEHKTKGDHESKGDHEGKCGESMATPAPEVTEEEAHGAKGE